MGGSMKVRPHRGSLKSAMEECVEILPTKKALEDHIGYKVVSVEKYGSGYDERIGWDTYIVMREYPNDTGKYPWGFTDGPLES